MSIGRIAIGVSPGFYTAVNRVNNAIISVGEWVMSGFGMAKSKPAGDKPVGIDGERECFRLGAEAIGLRGFDAVVFGHTHLEGTVEIADGVRYYNTGSWFSNPHCVAIDKGRIWFGPVSHLVKTGDPFPLSDDEAVQSLTGTFPVQHRQSVRLSQSAADAAAMPAVTR
jgi:hypothetical protein